MAVSFVLLLLFVFNGADGAHIIGGRDAPPHSRPYMVSLQVQGQHICGGALVREDFVLTAAHCRIRGTYTVVAGVNSFTSSEPTRQEFGVARLIPHPQYDPNRFRNDVMLIQLNNRAQLTEAVQLISLKPDRVNAGSRCLATGWGLIDSNTSPTTLQEVNVTVVSTQACRRNYGRSTITNAMVCAEGGRPFQGPYRGDSGGPLVCDGATAGVVSFGRIIGSPPAPAVYTRISSFRQWITSVINNS